MDSKINVTIKQAVNGYIVIDETTGEIYTATTILEGMLHILSICENVDKPHMNEVTKLLRAIWQEMHAAHTTYVDVSTKSINQTIPEHTQSLVGDKGNTLSSDKAQCIMCGNVLFKNKVKTACVRVRDLYRLLEYYPELAAIVEETHIANKALDAVINIDGLHGKCVAELYRYLRNAKK